MREMAVRLLITFYFLKVANPMKHIEKATNLLAVFFALVFFSNSAFATLVFKCTAYGDQGHKFSVAMPEKATDYLAFRSISGDVSTIERGQDVGVGSITFDNWGGSKFEAKLIVTRLPRTGYSPLGFFMFSDHPQILKINTEGTGPYPFELYDSLASVKTICMCR